MKITKERENLKSMGLDDLAKRIDSLQRELFSLRLSSATAHVKDYSQFSKLRKQIARALTEQSCRSAEQE